MSALHPPLPHPALRWGAAALLAASALLGGCAVVPAPVPVADGDVYTTVAPPTPQYEVVPVAPYVGAVWIGGYWNWYGGRHVWVPGRYVRPRPGYHWQARYWERGPRGGWALHGGHWVR